MSGAVDRPNNNCPAPYGEVWYVVHVDVFDHEYQRAHHHYPVTTIERWFGADAKAQSRRRAAELNEGIGSTVLWGHDLNKLLFEHYHWPERL